MRKWKLTIKSVLFSLHLSSTLAALPLSSPPLRFIRRIMGKIKQLSKPSNDGDDDRVEFSSSVGPWKREKTVGNVGDMCACVCKFSFVVVLLSLLAELSGWGSSPSRSTTDPWRKNNDSNPTMKQDGKTEKGEKSHENSNYAQERGLRRRLLAPRSFQALREELEKEERLSAEERGRKNSGSEDEGVGGGRSGELLRSREPFLRRTASLSFSFTRQRELDEDTSVLDLGVNVLFRNLEPVLPL